MRYIPDWETLAETSARVMTTNELSMSEAQLDICRAYRDGKLRAKYGVERVQTPYGFEVNRQAFGQPRSSLDRRDIIGLPRVPPDLIPDDIDWVNSRPKTPWLDNGKFVVLIAKIELSTADVIRILCGGGKRGRGESALHFPPKKSVPDVSGAEAKIASARRTSAPMPTKKSSTKRNRAQRAVKELWPNGPPSKDEMTDVELFRMVCEKLGPTAARDLSSDTVLRAAGRRK
jgi:hypothetical protein